MNPRYLLSTFKILLIIITFIVFCGTFSTIYVIYKLPDISNISEYKLSIPLRIYTQNKDLAGRFGLKNRSLITYDQIPPLFIKSILAAEDSRFEQHSGVDIKSTLRAVTQLFDYQNTHQTGASTITMQVARNYFLNNERTFYRKFKEILLALHIERKLSKQKIMELYTNKIYLGLGAYGIAAAAKNYYNLDIKQLNLAQLAMIAGLPKAPSRYNPIVNPTRALIRRNWILNRMLQLKYIDQIQYITAKQQGISAKDYSVKTSVDAQYISEMVRQTMIALPQFSNDLYTHGYNVHTTIKTNLQHAANKAIYNGLLNYDQRHGYRVPSIIHNITTPQNKLLEYSAIAEFLDGVDLIADLHPAIVVSVNEQGDQLQAILKDQTIVTINQQDIPWVFTHQLKMLSFKDIFKLGHQIVIKKISSNELEYNKWILSQLPQVQASLVAVSPHNGAILALSGGFSFQDSKFNRATQAYRQMGSSFKPILYGAALTKEYSAASIINDSPIVVNSLNKVWIPENSNLEFSGPIRLRRALYLSKNMVSIRLLRSLTVPYVTNFARKFGFSPRHMPQDLSLALGTIEATPLQAATAFAIIANGGHKIKSFLIDYIENNKGEVVYKSSATEVCYTNCEGKSIAPSIYPAATNYVLADMLQDVIRKGTGKKALALQREDIAGKTGTTNNKIDAWFSGFNPDIAASVWVGFDNPKSLNEYGSEAALPVWVNFMRSALKDSSERILDRPDDVITTLIDSTNGNLTNENNPYAIKEIFQSPQHLPKNNSTNNFNNQGKNNDHAIETQDLLF